LSMVVPGAMSAFRPSIVTEILFVNKDSMVLSFSLND
jgi:hypothetical protein